jgi:ribosomal protein L24E
MTTTPAASTALPALAANPSVCRYCGRPVEMNQTLNLYRRRNGQILLTCVACVRDAATKGPR